MSGALFLREKRLIFIKSVYKEKGVGSYRSIRPYTLVIGLHWF